MSMTQSRIESYKQTLIDGNLGSDYVTDHPDEKLIRINTCSTLRSLYLNADYFNKATIEFLKDKTDVEDTETDAYFNFQLLNAYNIIYLDGDWKTDDEGKDIETLRAECTERAGSDLMLAVKYIEKHNIKVIHHHAWIPTVFPVNAQKVKMGYHVFINCKEDIDADMRKDLFNYLQTNCAYGTTVLDENPLKSTQTLLPFATKLGEHGKPSRSYALSYSELLLLTIEDDDPDDERFYATPAIQRVSTAIGGEQVDITIRPEHLRDNSDESDDESDLIGEEEEIEEDEPEEDTSSSEEESIEEDKPLVMDPLIATMIKREDNDTPAEVVKSKLVKSPARKVSSCSISADIEAAMKSAHSSFKETNWTYQYGKSNSILFRFIDSLAYLHPRHRFFKMLSDNNARVKKIFPAIMRYMYVNYTVDSMGERTMDVGTCCEIMVRLMKPLIEIAFREFKDNDKQRNIEQDIRTVASDWFRKYGVDGMFRPKNKDGEILELLPVYRDYLAHAARGSRWSTENWLKDTNSLYDEYDRLWVKVFINKKQGTYRYEHYPSRGPKETVEMDDSIVENWEIACNYRRKRFERFKKACQDQVKRWIGFVKDFIMEGITNEIKPFGKDHKIISFDEAFPDDFMNPYDYGTIGHYVEIVRTWCLMFLFTGFYETYNLSDTIRMIMTAFTRKFIWIDSSKKEPVTWLYNIKQTNSLEAYPYNQWIEDPKGSETEQWMSVIYDRFIRPLLLTTNKTHNIEVLMTTMENAGICQETNPMNKLKPFCNLGTEIGTICKNVFKTFGGNPRPKMLHAAQADYFPMRNGWLKWIIKNGQPTGDYEFLTDTQDMYMGRYTQVNWDGPLERYDKNCDEYRAVKRVIEQIYPDEEGREYCMRMFASVLYGTGYKDRLFVMYGTGSDGKTTIVNAVQALLGQSGFGADATVIENGKRIALNRNMKGLASTMKAEALLVNASAKSSHDEGGISEAVDVRLCNTQEPQLDNKGRVTLNGATIKGILSGTASSTRKIYQEATSSVINALIIMQTNYKPYVDDPTDGLKRRFTMYHHRSKFITNESSSFVNTEYHYKADASVAKALTDEPKYWQALFYILLEYAQKNLRERILPLSKLPKPQCIEEACEETFTKYVISVMGAISNVIEKFGSDELGINNFNDLKDKLKRWNDKLPQPGEDVNHPYRFCEARKPDDVDKEITRGMVQYFGGHMYRLNEIPTQVISDSKPDYKYEPIRRGKNVAHKLIQSESLINFAKINGFDTRTFQTKFLRKHAMTTIDSTGSGKCKDENNEDVYIVGWRLVEGLDSGCY